MADVEGGRRYEERMGRRPRPSHTIMENNMETIILGLYGDNGKENGNYYIGVLWG